LQIELTQNEKMRIFSEYLVTFLGADVDETNDWATERVKDPLMHENPFKGLADIKSICRVKLAFVDSINKELLKEPK
jgi:hypothetical protein